MNAIIGPGSIASDAIDFRVVGKFRLHLDFMYPNGYRSRHELISAHL